tara:strand:+ start:5181 stop:5357 length:177 start_codon:yes stop_codon:yes gene_type:complete
MYIRNWRGNIVEINENVYNNEYEFYIKLWKIKYNIKIKNKIDIKQDIISYINGEKDFI